MISVVLLFSWLVIMSWTRDHLALSFKLVAYCSVLCVSVETNTCVGNLSGKQVWFIADNYYSFITKTIIESSCSVLILLNMGKRDFCFCFWYHWWTYILETSVCDLSIEAVNSFEIVKNPCNKFWFNCFAFIPLAVLYLFLLLLERHSVYLQLRSISVIFLMNKSNGLVIALLLAGFASCDGFGTMDCMFCL